LRCLPFPKYHFFLEPTPSRWVIESARAGALDALEKGTIRSRERVHRYWADYYLSLKWYPEAHEAYHAASREARSEFWKGMNLGWGGMVAYRMGNREEARTDLEEAYAAGVLRHPIHLETLGRLRAEAGDTRAAMDLLAQAMALRPRVDTALLLATQQERLGNFDRAERFLRQAMSLDASRPEPYRQLIDLLRRQGRAISAEEVVRQWEESRAGAGIEGDVPADAP
jgi:tetratricopeptide (TPR) repeat protein